MKKRIFKKWVVQVLGGYLALWITFIATTIESMGNKTYDIILIVSTLLAIGSFLLLNKYSNVFED